MREFFRGWKRKTGAVTLVMACLFMASWVRSLSMIDWLTMATWNSFWRLTLEDGVVELSRYRNVSGDPPQYRGTRSKGGRNSWTSESIVNPDGTTSLNGGWQGDVATADTKTEFCGFTYATRRWITPTFVMDLSFLVFPHRYVAIPLILLSAVLLLTPRQSTQKKISDPTATEVA
jgi:hypothetical protein